MNPGRTRPSGPIAVFVLVAIRLYRDGLARFLDADAGFLLSGASGDAGASLDRIEAVEPDVVLLDRLFENGVALVRKIIEASPRVRVIALAVSELESDILSYAQAGVSGFIMHDDSLDDLADKIRAVARGEVLCSPRTSATLLRGLRRAQAGLRMASGHGLTRREEEILRLLEEDLSNKQIAARLCLELPTVKNHLHNIYAKLGVHGRNAALTWLHAERRAGEAQLIR